MAKWARPASPAEKVWARPRISARQPMTAWPVKPAGPSGQPAGQNGPARPVRQKQVEDTAHIHGNYEHTYPQFVFLLFLIFSYSFATLFVIPRANIKSNPFLLFLFLCHPFLLRAPPTPPPNHNATLLLTSAPHTHSVASPPPPALAADCLHPGRLRSPSLPAAVLSKP